MARKIGLAGLGTNQAATTKRILAIFDRATPADIEAGAQWYGAASEIARDMSDASGYSFVRCCGILAALSPRTPWGRNVSLAWAFVTGAENGSGLRANWSAAIRVRDGGVLYGPKTLAFAANIAGDRDAVTVDVWAVRAALGSRVMDPEAALARKGVYSEIAAAYRAAAALRGVDPTTMQATVWVVVRGGRAG